jgi:hypothetical protein
MYDLELIPILEENKRGEIPHFKDTKKFSKEGESI